MLVVWIAWKIVDVLLKVKLMYQLCCGTNDSWDFDFASHCCRISDFNKAPAHTFGLRVLELKKRNEDDAMTMANVSTIFYIVATHFGQRQILRSWLLESCIW
ncbi:hypothetical protein QQ045_011268 [Rhodiola kirilowii]